MARFFYGGIAENGRIVKPTTGGDATRPNRVHITNDLAEAALMALSVQGNVYEVRPVGKVTVDPDGDPVSSFLCKKAKIERQFKWSEVRRYIQIRLDDEFQATNQEETVQVED